MQTGPLAADQSSTTNNVMNKSITNHDVLREAVHIDDQPLYRGPLGCCLIQVSAYRFKDDLLAWPDLSSQAA